MPQETFFNLPERKRNKVLKAAIKEFACNSYSQASINQIVERANISKGSLYQYFKNKKDLFVYIIELANDKMISRLQRELEEIEEFNFSYALRQIVKSSLDLIKKHPGLELVWYRVLKVEINLSHNIVEDSFDRLNQIIINLLKTGQQTGEIKLDVDLTAASNLVNQVFIHLMDYIYEQVAEFTKKDIASLSESELVTAVEALESEIINYSKRLFFIFEQGVKRN